MRPNFTHPLWPKFMCSARFYPRPEAFEQIWSNAFERGALWVRFWLFPPALLVLQAQRFINRCQAAWKGEPFRDDFRDQQGFFTGSLRGGNGEPFFCLTRRGHGLCVNTEILLPHSISLFPSEASFMFSHSLLRQIVQRTGKLSVGLCDGWVCGVV